MQPLVTCTHPSPYDKILSIFLKTSHVPLQDNEGWDDNIIVDGNRWIVVSKGNNGIWYLRDRSAHGLLCNDVEHKHMNT